MALKLRLPSIADETEAMAGHYQMLADPFIEFLLDYRPGEPFAAWVERVNGVSLGWHCPEPWLPGEFLFIEADGVVVGRVWLRHSLDAHMAEYEGHLGYVVLRGFRRREYASPALAMSLAHLHKADSDIAVVTCDSSNGASIALLEGAGATFERLAVSPTMTRRRYLLATSA